MDSRTWRVDSHCGHPAVVQGPISVSPVFLTKKSKRVKTLMKTQQVTLFEGKKCYFIPTLPNCFAEMGHKTDHREPLQNVFIVYSKAAGIMISRFEKLNSKSPRNWGTLAALQAFQSECQDRYLDTSNFSSHFRDVYSFRPSGEILSFRTPRFEHLMLDRQKVTEFCRFQQLELSCYPNACFIQRQNWRLFGVSILKTIIHLRRVRPRWTPSFNN